MVAYYMDIHGNIHTVSYPHHRMLLHTAQTYIVAYRYAIMFLIYMFWHNV